MVSTRCLPISIGLSLTVNCIDDSTSPTSLVSLTPYFPVCSNFVSNITKRFFSIRNSFDV
ncbi:unnamed protein product, partial [Rotaria magnacalcarata]